MFIRLRTPKYDQRVNEFAAQMRRFRDLFGTDNVSKWPRSAQRYITDMEARLCGALRRETRGQLS